MVCCFSNSVNMSVQDDEQVSSSEGLHRIKDHLLFNTLSFLVKVIKHCQVIKNPSRQQDMSQIWGKWLFPTECIGPKRCRQATRRVSDCYCAIRNSTSIPNLWRQFVVRMCHSSTFSKNCGLTRFAGKWLPVTQVIV